MIKSSNPDASRTISNISLEFDKVINASLASQTRTEYMKCSILYDRILRSRIIPLEDSDRYKYFSGYKQSVEKTEGCVTHIYRRSDTKFNRDTEEFYNCKITKLEVTVEVSPTNCMLRTWNTATIMMKL